MELNLRNSHSNSLIDDIHFRFQMLRDPISNQAYDLCEVSSSGLVGTTRTC
jgi:hypothetical protein